MLVKAHFHIVEEELVLVVGYRQLFAVRTYRQVDVFLTTLTRSHWDRKLGVHIPLLDGLVPS